MQIRARNGMGIVSMCVEMRPGARRAPRMLAVPACTGNTALGSEARSRGTVRARAMAGAMARATARPTATARSRTGAMGSASRRQT